MNSTLPENAIDSLPVPSAKQQEHIKYQSLLLLVSNLNKIIYVFPLTATILTALFWSHVNQIILASWLGAVYILSIARKIVHSKINLQRSSSINYRFWVKHMLFLDVVTGSLVGFSSLFLTSLPQELQWLLVIVIIAISMESVAGQSAIKSSFIAFTLPLFSGFILGSVLVGNNVFYILSILALLHFFFLYGNFAAMHNHLKTNLTLTFSNKELAEQLKQKNQALEISNEQVNATSQAKSKFIISMSQELRTPLQGMLSLLENAQKNPYDPEHLNSLSIARLSGVKLLTLLNDLMDVYRLEEGQLKPKVKEFEVRQHFEDLAHLMTINANNKGLKLFCTIDSKVPAKIESDPVRLSQITLNLLANALKFTSEGQIELRVTSKMRGEQTYLKVSVSDTGKGISHHEMKMLFQPFIQGKADAKALGNGLGLAISRELCQLLNGEMSVQSAAEEGAIFSFKIPVQVKQKNEVTKFYNQKGILLVEGEHQHQTSIEQQLRFLNIPYEAATNIKEAMTTCAEKRNKFSAVIIGNQSKLQQKLLTNLCQRLKLPIIELFEFGKENKNEQLVLNYPVKVEELKTVIKNF